MERKLPVPAPDIVHPQVSLLAVDAQGWKTEYEFSASFPTITNLCSLMYALDPFA
jgi:hypothetical protein